MSPNPLRRRLGRGGLSLLVAATGTTLLWAGAPSAFAGPSSPDPVCANGTCTVTFGVSGGIQNFQVPAGVTSIDADLKGAVGGNYGGKGGETSGTVAVQPGADLVVVVGAKGANGTTGGAGGYGGGGAGGGSELGAPGGGGGGGSFLFATSGLLLAAGGGAGGGGGLPNGGFGAGANSVAQSGFSAPGAGGGSPATADSNGEGGFGNDAGAAGSGSTTDAAHLATGGHGGFAFDGILFGGGGGGGGGGYHAGGGGGGGHFSDGAGGGGGAGFAAQGVTNVQGAQAVQQADGVVTISYADGPSVSFTSQAPSDAVVGDTYTAKATGTGSGEVSYTISSATPEGACTIDGAKVSFVHAGSCVVKATQGDVSATQTITIGKGTPVVSLTLPETGKVGDELTLKPTSSVTGQAVVLTVDPASSPGACTLDGQTLSLKGEGTCTVLAVTLATDDYVASASVSRTIAVERVATKTTLSSVPTQPVYGQSVTVTATVTGATKGSVLFVVSGIDQGTTVPLVDGKASVTYPAPTSSGQPQYPNAGSYSTTATFTPEDPSTYAGSSTTGDLSWNQAPQQITVSPLGPTAKVGDTPVELTTTGGESDNEVTLTVDPSSTPGACALNGRTVSFTGKGTCTVTARQDGDGNYRAAEPVSRTVEVSQVTTTTLLSVNPTEPVYGQAVTATAKVTAKVPGAVQFSVDQEPLGGPVVVVDGSASKTLPTDLSAKGHTIKAVFVPTDAVTFAGSSMSMELGVAKSLAKATLKVRTDEASVLVSAVAPGSGTPEGDVVFTVNGKATTKALVHGRATLSASIPDGAAVSVAYAGDTSFTPASDSSSRTDPTITATVTEPASKSEFGWYRAPVTVTFTCKAGSAPLEGACPEPVVLTEDGASQEVTRTVTAEDGGIATANVTGLNIDQTKPKVLATEVKDGARYFASAPEAGCAATDELSGVIGCEAKRTVSGEKVTYRVVAVDRAGNEAAVETVVTVYKYGVAKATYANGVWTVKKGESYDLIAASSGKPRLYKIVGEGKKPTTKGPDKFRSTGDGTWAYTYYMGKSLKVGKTYNIGIKTDKLHVVTIHVV